MANELKEGASAPSFRLETDSGEKISLADFAGKNVVLYFYPKDDTPGCTKEACGFQDALSSFKQLDAIVLGVSKDSVASHQKFKKKYSLTFPLLADVEGKVCEAYGVWKEKSMYGRKYMGIERTTFVIDAKGKIAKIFSNVSVTGHIDEVAEAVKTL